MFQKIASKINGPEWWRNDPRFCQLEYYDRMLDGTFYNHLQHGFYEETDSSGRMIEIQDRIPAAQFNLPLKVARDTSRKLFAGRHVPRIYHPDKATRKAARNLARRTHLNETMREIAVRGSVGSVACTFAVFKQGDQASALIRVWKAKYCEPTFDGAGNLENLRIQYVTSASALKALGLTLWDADCANWWFIRDFTKTDEIWYVPIRKDDWNPVDGFKNDLARARGFAIDDDKSSKHDFGFVPGQWFKNLSGGDGCDGASTWGPAVDNCVELDYTLSQVGRGVRYNAAPQLVTVGDLIGGAEGIVRGPAFHLAFDAARKNEEGETLGAGDAKLLEMTGKGVEAGLAYVDKLRNMALEQISAARKDPEQMKGPMSGRAMEFLDEEFHDLVMELRSSYGDDGMLPLIQKMLIAIAIYGRKSPPETELLSLRWPRLFQPTPTDLAQIMPAFQIALNPFGQPEATKNPDGTTTPPPEPDEAKQMLTLAEIRAWLTDNMDLGLLDEEGDEDDQEMEEPDEPVAPIDDLPPPDPDGGGPDDGPGEEVAEGAADADPFAQATAGGVAKVTVRQQL